MKNSDAIKVGGAAVLIVAAAVIVFVRMGGGEEEGAYFYDLSEAKLYRAPRDAFAPIEGKGGESGDGVEAVVAECPKCGESSRKIAYLRTHTPEYKQKREEAEAAGVDIEGLTREWIADNTLVKRVEDAEWVAASSEEGGAIVRGWLFKCETHGEWAKALRP